MILEIEAVTKSFDGGRRGLWRRVPKVVALSDVTLSIRRGESFGIVGESGSGKSTLARCILRLEEISSGRILFEGTDLAKLTPRQLQRLRARIQIVFQDPYTSLNPRMSVHDILVEPMEIHRDRLGLGARGRTDRAVEMLERVGLGVQHLYRFPHEFSGGQRQRIGIARALMLRPDFLILDEPTSALDVSVQAQVLNLLHELQAEFGLTYLFISHDLAVIRYICDRLALMHRGRIVERGDAEAIFQRPETEYARTLLAAMPDPDPDRSPFL